MYMKFSFAEAGERLVRWCLYATLFLTPIFFLPWTPYAVSLNKEALFIALIFIAVIAWLIVNISRGELSYVKSPMNGVALGLVAFVIVSALLSHARAISLMGVTGGEVDTALSIAGFILFYFLLIGTMREERLLERAGIILIVSSAAVFVLSALQIFGIRFLPWDFTQSAIFNPIGTTNALALYFGCMFVLAFCAAYFNGGWRRKARAALGVFAVALFIASVLIGYWPMFIGISAAMLIIVAADLRAHGTAASRRCLLPLAVAVFSLFIILSSSGAMGGVRLPRIAAPPEITPSIAASWQIVKSTARESVKNFAFGSGPATYQYQYGKYRDAALNQSPFWNIRFDQGANAVLTHLVSWGVIGTVLFLLFVAVWLYESFRVLVQARASVPWAAAGLTAAGVYLAVALFVYPHNFTLYFLLFAFAGLATALHGSDAGARRIISFTASPRGTFGWSLGMLFLIMIFASVIYATGRRYAGAVYFEKGMKAANAANDVERVAPFFTDAFALDPGNDGYLQAMASIFLMRANALAATVTGAPSSSQKIQFENAMSAAVAHAEQSVKANPDNTANWIGLGRTYEAVAPFIDGAADKAFEAYKRAALLDPNNPAIAVNLGNAHSAYADRLLKEKRDSEYQLALDSFQKALLLKSDYAPAHFALVQIFDRQGKVDEAVARAERLQSLAPDDVGILFQLGLLHYQANRLGKARDVLEAAVRQSPDYANALYFLGLIYDKQGEQVLALERLERVLQLNPDNKEVLAIIDNVRARRPALQSGAEPLPLEEKETNTILEKNKK